jgi:AraC-like DNA-binding protein
MLEDLVIYTPMYITLFWAIVLLITKRENNRAKFFLGVFLFTAFLLYLSHAHFFKKHIASFQYFDSIYMFSSLSVYPLYYWYIRLLSVETNYRQKNLLLLLPGVLLALASFVIYRLMGDEEKLLYITGYVFKEQQITELTKLMQIQRAIYVVSRIIFIVQVLVLLFHGRKLIINHQKNIANFYSNLENRSILWVKYMLYSIVVTSLMSLVFNLVGRSFFLDLPEILMIPSLVFSILLFFIGVQGYMQNHTVYDLQLDVLQGEAVTTKKINTNKLKEKLIELFLHEKVYKNPDLKITQISEMLNTNRTYISKLINTEFSCTFSEFVNRYRVKEAKQLLCEESSKNYSLDYIAEKSGFGSMVNFMRVFRDIEGTTPGKYREMKLNNRKVS